MGVETHANIYCGPLIGRRRRRFLALEFPFFNLRIMKFSVRKLAKDSSDKR